MLFLADISGFQFVRIPRNSVLLVKRKESSALSFIGLKETDLPAIRSAGLGPVEETQLAVSGHNWGNVEIDGASLIFKVGDKPSFVIPLPDVAQVNQGRDEVLVQFPVDDTAVGDREDALVEVSFHVPKDCPDFKHENGNANGTDGDGAPVATVPASKVLFDVVSGFTDTGAGAGDAIATFDSVGVLVPRGRFDTELYASSLKLVGQAQDFRVQYDSILRIFVLPKSNSPQTLVAISLDPPIRKGQTFYNTILCQFHNDEEMSLELELSEEAIKAKNEKGAKLQKVMRGASPDVFARVLRGLSGSKLTRPGAFKDAQGEGNAVRCSYKADDGYLYPLERAFFYVQKPPLLMAFDEVESIEFMRQATGVTAAKTFDLAVRMRNGQDHLFRGIPREEWENLFEFIRAKQLRIENFKEASKGPGVGAMASYRGDEFVGVDAGLAAQRAFGSESESDSGGSEEEDVDFKAQSESSESEDDEDEDGDVKIVPENEEGEEPKKKKAKVEKKKKEKKEGEGGGAGGAEGGEEGGKKARKPRKKKDKNAPKKNLSAFMFFSNDKREQVKTENPGIAFGEVGKKLGEMWKSLSAEGKAPYNAKAEEDKGRYAIEMEAYKKKLAGEGGEGDKEEEEEEEQAEDEKGKITAPADTPAKVLKKEEPMEVDAVVKPEDGDDAS